MMAQEQTRLNTKTIRVIKHNDGTYSVPLSTFTIKKPSFRYVCMGDNIGRIPRPKKRCV